jgi:cytoskeletal protein CcmA (bactofilin family)
VIGPNLQIVGTINSSGGVRIEGRLEGDVACRTLAIGPTGVLLGNAVAEAAEIEGAVDGKITADSVVLGASARVTGEVVQRKLVIQPGADFEGSVRRLDAAPEAAEKASGGAERPAGAGAKTATA